MVKIVTCGKCGDEIGLAMMINIERDEIVCGNCDPQHGVTCSECGYERPCPC